MIRFLLRWSLRFLALGACLLVVALLARDLLLRQWVRYRVSAVTGLKTELSGLSTSFRDKTITLSDLRLHNSPEFGDGEMAVIPELHVEIDSDALARREWRLSLARVHLSSLHVVRNASGRTNIIELSRAVQERASLVDAVWIAPPGLEFTGIETLDVTVGDVWLADLTPPGFSQKIPVGLTHEKLHNVDEFSDLSPLVLRVIFQQITQGFRGR